MIRSIKKAGKSVSGGETSGSTQQHLKAGLMLPADTQQYGSLYLGQIGKILEQTPWVGSVNSPVEVIPFPLNTEGKKKIV